MAEEDSGLSSIEKIKAYAIDNNKAIADLKAMGKRAVVDAAGLTRQQARGLFKSIKRYKAEKDRDASDVKLNTITTKMRDGTLPAKPDAVVEEIEPSISYKVTPDGV